MELLANSERLTTLASMRSGDRRAGEITEFRRCPCKLNAPFNLVIDQQDRICVDNAFGGPVARFPANDPSKVEALSTGGHSGKRMAVDSKEMCGSPTRWDRARPWKPRRVCCFWASWKGGPSRAWMSLR
jgi:hypothetical protein